MEIAFEWGAPGIAACRERAAVLVVVDVLSFSTCVDIAVGRGAAVVPFASADAAAARAEAARLGAIAARRRRDMDGSGADNLPYSLSPTSLTAIPAGTTLLLPSPNGSRLSLASGRAAVLAGCLRNATAVARAALCLAQHGVVGVIAAGEHWPDGRWREADEDLLGAGAVIDALDAARPGSCTPAAAQARDAFRAARDRLAEMIHATVSAGELIGWGFASDVTLAAAHDVSVVAPVLTDGVYRAWAMDGR